MNRTQPVQNCFRLLAKNEAGFLMVACLVLLTTLTLIGTTAYILASTEIKVGAGFRNARSVFQAAQAGARSRPRAPETDQFKSKHGGRPDFVQFGARLLCGRESFPNYRCPGELQFYGRVEQRSWRCGRQ